MDLMNDTRIEDLSRLYRLFSRVSCLDLLKAAFSNYVKVVGLSLLSDPSRDSIMVQDLLDFKARLDKILKEAFSKNEAFANSLKEAFEHFINQRQNKPAECIAKFVDGLLRGSQKSASSLEIESILDACLVLFRYIQGIVYIFFCSHFILFKI